MDERDVLRCQHCRLRQFRTVSGNCRKCRQPYVSAPAPELADKPVGSIPARNDRLDIGSAVRVLRLARNISQQDLASRMGCPRTYLSKVERGASPTIKSFLAIADALEVEPWVLIYFADPWFHMEKAA